MRITPPAARGRRPTYVEFGAADWLVLARAPVGGVSGAQDQPFSAERRAGPPEGASRLALFIGVAPDSDLPTDDTPRS
jgi:hypothetical protein